MTDDIAATPDRKMSANNTFSGHALHRLGLLLVCRSEKVIPDGSFSVPRSEATC